MDLGTEGPTLCLLMDRWELCLVRMDILENKDSPYTAKQRQEDLFEYSGYRHA